MKKLNIGLFVDQLERSYQSQMWHTISTSLNAKGHNCIIFSGKNFNVPYIDDQSQNIIYTLAKTDQLDGLISITGLLTSLISLPEYSLFLNKMAPLPIVSIDTHIEGYPSIITDNKSGIIEAVDHLAAVHQCQNIFFIAGPEKHWESKERLEGFKQGLHNNNLKFHEDWVFRGDFREESGRAAAACMIQKGIESFDAVISSNDSMLTGAMDLFFESGIEIPGDIAAIGFDNSPEAQICFPSISSISQPYNEMVEQAIGALIDLIEKRQPKELITLPARLVIRESCGCSPPIMIHSREGSSSQDVIDTIRNNLIRLLREDMDREKKGELFIKTAKQLLIRDIRNGVDLSSSPNILHEIENFISGMKTDRSERGIYFEKLNELRKYYIQTLINTYRKTTFEAERHQLNLMRINQALISPKKRETLLGSIRYNFPQLGIDYTKLVEFTGPVTWDGRLEWILPKKSRLIGEYGLGQHSIHREGEETDTFDWIPGWIRTAEDPVVLITMALSFQRQQLGFIIMQQGEGIDIMYETLRGQIASALNGINLLNEQAEYSKKLRRMYHELEQSHNRIERISITDELTGLYNRRGFSTVADRIVELAKRTNRTLLVIYIDLDGLKTINDNFGHNEGDIALKTAADILQETFRTSDLIARLGGDEFIILGVDIERKVLESILKRLFLSLEKYNNTSNKPYLISVSTGIASSGTGASNLETLMGEADALLYKEKQRKKTSNSVLRNNK